MASFGVIHTAGGLAALRSGKGRRSRGSNYWWNDVAFRQSMKNQMRAMLVSKAQNASEYAASQMQDLGGAHAPAGQFPAVQSGNLQDAMDYEFFGENSRWMVARFGVFGDVARRSQADFSNEYDDPTPVGVYAYTLATGVGRMGKKWPWVQKTINEVADNGWKDVETASMVRDYAV